MATRNRAKPRTTNPLADLGRRKSGVLCHPTSLPGPFGIGDLGPGARAFVDFLARGRQAFWQMLPIGPVGYGNSPYSALSTFALSPQLISLEDLVDLGLLPGERLGERPPIDHGAAAARVHYGVVGPWKTELVRAAFARFVGTAAERPDLAEDFAAFCTRERGWLDDFALYFAAKAAHGGASWTDWEPSLRGRQRTALATARKTYAEQIDFHRFEQWIADRQWRALRAYAAERNVGLIGDVPIFVAHDSADVWAHPDLWKLDRGGHPRVVAGVPPDYFSRTGQRWGNPLYDWKRHAATRYRWWVERMQKTLGRFDVVRLDHFIGFQRYWEVPASAPTAETGRWLPGPRDALFDAIRRATGGLPLIAEDLGLVTPEVTALRERHGMPGIKILQFAFGGDASNDFLPHNWERHAVAYTGSHDNDTFMGWWNDRSGVGTTQSAEQAESQRRYALQYLDTDGHELHWQAIRALEASVANLVIVPAQDLLGLGSFARMNLPGSAEANWEWRLQPGEASEAVADRLSHLVGLYGRFPRR